MNGFFKCKRNTICGSTNFARDFPSIASPSLRQVTVRRDCEASGSFSFIDSLSKYLSALTYRYSVLLAPLHQKMLFFCLQLVAKYPIMP